MRLYAALFLKTSTPKGVYPYEFQVKGYFPSDKILGLRAYNCPNNLFF